MEGRIGAEAVIIPQDGMLVKRRVSKRYRLKQLDERIRKQRTALEARLLGRAAQAGVLCPRVSEHTDYDIIFERIEGTRAKELLEEGGGKEIFGHIGKSVALLHSADIIHGDLTTTNMIWNGSMLFLIDFGLGRHSKRVEDKAMDLYLLSNLLQAGHPVQYAAGWKSILKAYEHNYVNAKAAEGQLEKIRKRRRYK